MIKDKWICLVILGLILILCSGTSGNNDFDRAVIDKIVDLYSLDTTSTEVEIIRTGIPVPAENYDSLRVTPLSEAPADGLAPFLITIYQKDGQLSTGQARARIRRFADVLITADRLKQHEAVTPDKVILERMEITSLTERSLTNAAELKGKWTKRGINKGQILSTGLLEEIPAIVTGQGVSILYRMSNMEITAAGTALEAGYKNEMIKVRNTQSGRIISCAIIDSQTVQVSAP